MHMQARLRPLWLQRQAPAAAAPVLHSDAADPGTNNAFAFAGKYTPGNQDAGLISIMASRATLFGGAGRWRSVWAG
jgi:hypothetical protein